VAATAFDAEALQSAFAQFNRQSHLLEASYRELKAKVSSLTRELKEEQSARHKELLDKERLGDRLSGMLEVLPAAVIVIDGAGIIRELNSKAMELLNRPLLGCPWSDVVRREFCAGKSADGELMLRDGRWLSLSRRPLENEPGEILLLSDVTESRRMSDLMHRHQRLSNIGEMTASLAHQIRTPLTCAMLMLGQLEGMPSERKSGAERESTVGKIMARLQELASMVDDMLRFAGGVRRVGESIVVGDLFTEVIEDIAPKLQGGIRITSEVPDRDLTIIGNRGALKGALLNLVENAAQACRRDGRIELSAWRSLDHACLAVSDNGHGISKETQARLFEPFFTTRPQGTGLGLAVVRSVAEAHDGQILCQSVPGETVFAICIPVTAAQGFVVNTSAPPAAARNPVAVRPSSELAHV
jgi:two-component system sensor histidine kinase FlrB